MATLLAGYTDAFDERLIRSCFDDDVIVCSTRNQRAKGVRWVAVRSESTYEELEQTYDFDRVVYVSNFLNRMVDDAGELGNLRACLHSMHHDANVKFVYVGSNIVLMDRSNSQKVVCSALERLCDYYHEQRGIQTLVVRSPYLSCPTVPGDYLYRAFDALETTGSFTLLGKGDQRTNSMTADDLADFLRRLFVDWRGELGTIDLIGPEGITYQEVAAQLEALVPGSAVGFSGTGSTTVVAYGPDNAARDFYHWRAQSEPAEYLRQAYERYREARGGKLSWRTRASRWMRSHRTVTIAVEMVVGAVVVELLEAYLGGTAQFRMVDVRLLYIVLFAIAYGVTPGTVAAAVMCVSLARSYVAAGMPLSSLFFWFQGSLPFILYLALGGVVGYVSTRQTESEEFLREEYDLQRDRLQYIEDLYHDSLDVKNTYRNELIRSRSGFGMIYDVVERLSVFEPREIFMQSVSVVEEVLDNHSVAIFAIDRKSPSFARLQVCSQEVSATTPKTIDLVKSKAIVDALDKGDVWFNHALDKSQPDYVAAVRDNGSLRVLITLRDVRFDQMNAYYVNMIRMVTKLMENFLVKAWEYQATQANSRYVAGTNILAAPALNEELRRCRDMDERRVATYRLLRIGTHGEGIGELDQALRPMVRSSDFLGLGYDGSLYLIALQVDEASEPFVLNRFRSRGWECEVVRDVRGDV